MKKALLFFLSFFLIHLTTKPQSCIPGGIYLGTQESIDNFQSNYPDCTEIEGEVLISGNDVSNLQGLSAITSMGSLEINSCFSLADLDGLENLQIINGDFIIYRTVIDDFSGLENLQGISGDFVLRGLPYIINMQGLSDLTNIGGSFTIGKYMGHGNISLVNLDGLTQLKSIGEDLLISNNDTLQNLSGLESLDSIGRYITIKENPNLRNLKGLENIKNVITLGLSDNFNLESLADLNLNSLGYFIIINADKLTSLAGLENINPNLLQNFTLSDNDSLSACAVKSICEFLSSTSADVTIMYNAAGCEDAEAILQSCNSSVPEPGNEDVVQIYPNPANNLLYINMTEAHSISRIDIFNRTGQLLKRFNGPASGYDISALTTGLFILEIHTDNYVVRKKLLVKE